MQVSIVTNLMTGKLTEIHEDTPYTLCKIYLSSAKYTCLFAGLLSRECKAVVNFSIFCIGHHSVNNYQSTRTQNTKKDENNKLHSFHFAISEECILYLVFS